MPGTPPGAYISFSLSTSDGLESSSVVKAGNRTKTIYYLNYMLYVYTCLYKKSHHSIQRSIQRIFALGDLVELKRDHSDFNDLYPELYVPVHISSL